MQYRTNLFLNVEVPELGWGVVQAKSPEQSLSKSYIE